MALLPMQGAQNHGKLVPSLFLAISLFSLALAPLSVLAQAPPSNSSATLELPQTLNPPDSGNSTTDYEFSGLPQEPSAFLRVVGGQSDATAGQFWLKALERIGRSLYAATTSSQFSSSVYQDSDGDLMLKNSSALRFSSPGLNLSLSHQRTDAFDPKKGYQAADQILTEISAPLTEELSSKAGLGYARMGSHVPDPIGYLRTEASVPAGKVTLAVSREALTDSTQGIKRDLKFTQFGVDWSERLPAKFSVRLDYDYQTYSDSNHSNRTDFRFQRKFRADWSNFELGYRFTYLDFAHSSPGGYWAPIGLLSHTAFAGWSFDRSCCYANVDLSLGPQNTRIYSGGGNATVGVRISKRISVEMYAEGSNSALASSGAWSYLTTSAQVKYVF